MKRIIRFLFVACVMITLHMTAFSVNAASRLECIWTIVAESAIDFENTDETVLDAFSDGADAKEDWRVKHVCAAIENKIIVGYEDHTLRLNEEVTRAEFACMIYRARGFYNTFPTVTVTYNGGYTDLSDWNEKEIRYSMENGFLMGYGDRFGSEDVITTEQLNIVLHRIKYGLTTREKYTLMEICRLSPISMDKIFNSAYDESLKAVALKTYSTPEKTNPIETEVSVNTFETAIWLENILEMQGNLDYEKLQSPAYKEYLVDTFTVGLVRTYPTYIYENGVKSTIEERIQSTEETKTKRESIFVISPLNNREFQMLTASNHKTGAGYEYYQYLSADGGTPNGEETGKWYRRSVTVEYVQYKTASTQYAEMKCSYGKPEEWTN